MASGTQTRSPKGAETHDPLTKQRKPVPKGIDMSTMLVDERKELVELFAPECLNRKDDAGNVIRDSSEFTPFFDDPDIDPAIYRRQGYIPIIDKETDKQVVHRGDRLWELPRELFAKRKARSAEISRRAAESSLEAEDADASQHGFTTTVPAGG